MAIKPYYEILGETQMSSPLPPLPPKPEPLISLRPEESKYKKINKLLIEIQHETIELETQLEVVLDFIYDFFHKEKTENYLRKEAAHILSIHGRMG